MAILHDPLESKVRERRIVQISVAGLFALAGSALMFAGSLRDWATHENVFVGGTRGVHGLDLDGWVTLTLAILVTIATFVLFAVDHPWVRGIMLGLSVAVLAIGLVFLADLSDKAREVGDPRLHYGLGDGLVWLISGSAINTVAALVTVKWEFRIGRVR